MCGIIGYVGDKGAKDIIFKGLKALEYRGYDSSGIALHVGGEFQLEKEKGKLSKLQDVMAKLSDDAVQGIGHTRWATHGVPNQVNAHPHIAGNVVLVHNGIIENDDELRKELSGKVSLLSETDTELVAQLLNIELEKTGGDRLKAIFATVKQLEGAFGLAVMFKDDADTIYGVRKESPLAVGLSATEGVIGSDTNIFPSQCKKGVLLGNKEIAVVRRGEVEVYDFDGNKKDFDFVALNLTDGLIDKKGYRHFMLKEIYEQPGVVAHTLSRFVKEDDYATINPANILESDLNLKDFTNIQVVACGTAYLAGFLAKYLLEPHLKIPINVELASEFRYREPHFDKNSLVIAVSQSGETADTLASIQYAKEQGCKVLAVCNNPTASIPREAHHTIHMEAGQEIGVASTKAYVSQVLCLYMWGLSQAEALGRIDKAQLKSILTDLHKLPLYLDQSLTAAPQIEALAKKYYEFPNFLFLGRGPSYPVACEGSLKLKEISYIHAEAYAAGELKHGPIALIDRHMPSMVIAPKDAYYPKTLANIKEIKAREGIVIAIGDKNDKVLSDVCDDIIHLPHAEDKGSQAIISTIPVQLFSYYVACHRGTDVDQPRNLAKSVTVE